MDNKNVFITIGNMEEQIVQLSTQLGILKNHLEDVLEENHHLKLENEHLRRRLEELEEKSQKPSKGKQRKKRQSPDISEGHDNLARLYYEGFHICNVHYGSVRQNGEDCLFCISFLNKK